MLEVQGLRTWFQLRHAMLKAVDDVSFSLTRGKTLCVVGESGSGKSITARSILQIVDPPGRIVEGRILLHRHRTAKGSGEEETIDLAALHPRSRAIRAIRGRDIAMIFQEPMSSLSPVHTIGNQVAEAIRLHEPMSRRQARERTVELLRQVEIPRPEQAIDRYPFEFSGGMRQRAVIAMALACNPTVLIADEPTTALDVTTQAEILDLIKRLQAEYGMAVMFITHDMGVVAEIADEIVVMRYGKLVERGDVHAIFARPQHPYTKMLLQAVVELDQPSVRRLAMRERRPLGPPDPRAREAAERSSTARAAAGSGDARTRWRPWRTSISPSRKARTWASSARAARARRRSAAACSASTTRPAAGCSTRRPTAASTTSRPAEGGELKTMRRELRMIFQDPFASLNPRMTVGQIVGEPLLVNGIAKGDALRERVTELLKLVGPPALGGRALSPRLLGRPAPAHQRRPRHRPRAPDHRRRRGDLGPRRQPPHPGPRPPARPPGAARPQLHLHQPRHRGDPLFLRPHRRHVSRADRRAGRDRGGLHEPTASLYAGSPVRRAQTGPAPARHAWAPPLSGPVMSVDLVPPAVRARLAPGMAEAMGHELAAAEGLPPPHDLAEQRARGIASAAFWSEELPPVAAIEDHRAPGPAGEVPVRLFRPHAGKDGPTPVLLYIHGGGWAQGSVRQNEPAIHALASASGWSVAALSYRLAPENPYPAGLEDCLAVAEWLRATGPQLGLDPERIALGGASAGANLALAAGLGLSDQRRGRLGPPPLLRHIWPRPGHAVLPRVRRWQLRLCRAPRWPSISTGTTRPAVATAIR